MNDEEKKVNENAEGLNSPSSSKSKISKKELASFLSFGGVLGAMTNDGYMESLDRKDDDDDI